MRKALLFTVLLCLPFVASAAENPWAGKWKLDVSKSHFTGTTFSYAKTADGKMRYDDGGPDPFVFAIDGKPYLDASGLAHIWTSTGPNAWLSVAKRGDKELSRNKRILSEDGKTLYTTNEGTKPDGTAFDNHFTYERVTGDKGLEGTWRSTEFVISAPDAWIISYPTPDTFRWEVASFKMVTTGKMDGSDAHVTGEGWPASETISVMQNSPRKFTSTTKSNGKVDGVSVDVLSADGRMITEESWTPGKESEKQTAIYVKE